MKKKGTTAEELMAQLERDPAFLGQRAAREAALSALAVESRRDEAFLVGELRSLGFDVDSVWDFVNTGNKHEFLKSRVAADYRAAHPVLLRHLLVPHHPRVREGIIRALTIRGVGAHVWQALLREFEAEED